MLTIDWIELGCLGWHIDNVGAWMDLDWQLGPGFRCHMYDCASLNRVSGLLLLHGCPDFVRTVNDHLSRCGYARQSDTVSTANSSWMMWTQE